MIAVVFPGQGSQSPGMGRELFEANAQSRETFARVSQAVGFDVSALCFSADDETLRQTQNAQIALYATSLAVYSALMAGLSEQEKASVIALAGHSVGEYAALAASGVYSLEDGARLVQARGRLMAEVGKTSPGTMAAVLGLSRDLLGTACLAAGGIVVVANDNCPGQLVISGEVDAVGRAGELAKEAGAKRVLPLNVSGAFHSPLMETAAAEMAKELSKVVPGVGSLPVYSNVSAGPIDDASHWPKMLERQLKSPVRWTETIEHMRRDGVLLFIECGPGEVLSGLIRRTDKEAKTVRAGDPVSLDASVLAVRELVVSI